MPANVTIQFEKAREKLRNARTNEEKLAALLEMKRTAPGHKGGEKLRAEISKKIARAKRGMDKAREQQKKASRKTLHVKKEGIGQIVLVGLPNSGKSTLLKMLTAADVEVASYPFTTKTPISGMMNYKGAWLQLVEIPALIEGSGRGKAQGPQLLSIIRNGDAIALVLNAGSALREFDVLEKELQSANMRLNQSKPKIEINHSKFRGITIAGKKYLKIKEQELVDLLKSMGIYNAEVILQEDTTIEKIVQVLDEKLVYKRCLAVLNEFSGKGADELKGKMPAVVLKKENLEEIKKQLFLLLEKVLVYTKKPGKDADYKEPMVLQKGATVDDVAKVLHKDFAEKLRYVKVWGSTKFPGQRVSRDYKLQNEDLIEIYS